MSHAEALASLKADLARLRARCEAVSENLVSASREMKTGGTLPGVALIDELDHVRSQFADLRRGTLQLVAAVAGTRPTDNPQADSPLALEALLEAAQGTLERQAAERARQQALAVLERVQHMRHRDHAPFPPLEQCRVLAGGLRDALSSLESPTTHAELGPLAEGRHPLAYLVEFAEDQSGLDDARWEFLHDALSQAFGRPLAVAAARGKLWVSNDIGSPAGDAVAPSFEPEADDAEDEWPTSTLAWPEAEPSDQPASGGRASTWSTQHASAPDHGPQSHFDVATMPRSTHRDGFDPLEPDMLIWQALLRDRPSAAFLVASYASGDLRASRSVPNWLLRALALSSRLRHVNGDIALQLTDDFACWDSRDFGSASDGDDVVQAVWLLVLASALRPALVAPDCGAWTVLRALPENAALPNLQHYSGVIAGYGERHPALAPHTFGLSLSPAAWRDALEDLLREIGAWRVRFLGLRSTFPPATEVWRHWLRPDGPVHALLAPLTLDHHGLETARGLVERLSNTAQIHWEIAETDRRRLGRQHGPDIAARPADADQLADRMREAVAFARRWIALQEHRPGRPDDEPRRLAQTLREQLIQLRSAVEQEVAGLSVSGAALPVRAAVAQCQAALASVDALLGEAPPSDTGSWWTPAEEPPPRLVLQGDLLHLPGLELDPTWHLRRVEPGRVLRGLQTLVMADEPPDWQKTFAVHLQSQDHLATAQVIECVELHDRSLSGELQAVRTDDLARARTNLRSEVELTRDRVDLAAAQGRLGDQERARLVSRVERIALTLPSLLRFGPPRERLRHIREHVESLPAGDDNESAGRARARERDNLAAADGACLLVARPSMGTSTLLDDAAEAYRASGQQRLALVVDLSRDLSGDHPADHLDHRHQSERRWDSLAAALSRAGLAPPAGSPRQGLSADDVIGAVHTWLAEDPARHLLLAVDHADAVLDEEAHLASLETPGMVDGEAFPNSARLAQLMQSSNGRVKVVLAGSLTVLRASRLRDFPLAAGGCVRLGPLLEDGGWHEAAALLHQRLDGTQAQSTQVIARALSLANYEPGAISRFGGLLAERVSASTLTLTVLDNVIASREGAETLTAGVVGMLRRDPRHAVVVYCLALAAWAEHANSADEEADVEGVTSGWLREQVSLWWPHGFAHAWSDDAFDDLLEELLALGLVRTVAADRFILGSPNSLPLLGTQEELIARLFDYGSNAPDASSDVEYEYAPASFRPAVAAAPAGRSPLTARQLSRLLGPEQTCTVVVGTAAAGLLQVAPALHALAESTRVVTLDPSTQAADCAALLRRVEEAAAQEDADSHVTLVVPHTWAWTREWLVRVLDHMHRIQAARRAPCQVLLVADPAATWRLLDQPGDGELSWRASLAARGVASVSLTPWRESVIRQWSAEMVPDGLADADLDLLDQVTGGWPLLLEHLRPDAARSCQSRLQELAVSLAGDTAGQWAAAFGLDLSPARALQPLAVLGHTSEASLAELVDAPLKAVVSRSLEWARMLHLARPLGAGQWRMDPIAARVLRAATKPLL